MSFNRDDTIAIPMEEFVPIVEDSDDYGKADAVVRKYEELRCARIVSAKLRVIYFAKHRLICCLQYGPAHVYVDGMKWIDDCGHVLDALMRREEARHLCDEVR